MRSRRVIYRTVVDAESSLQHVYFSEALMQREINKALSAAIERFFGNQALYDALQQAQQVRVNTLGGSFFKNKFPEAFCVEVQCCLRKLP